MTSSKTSSASPTLSKTLAGSKTETGTTTQTPSIGVKLYADIARAYQLVAKRSYELCGVTLSATQVQATTWVTYRRLLGYN
jgi:hypothetical protein